MLKRLLPAIAAIAIYRTATALASTPALILYPGSGGSSVENGEAWESPELIVYESEECDESNANECALITLRCDYRWGPGLMIRVHGLENEELAEWLMQERELSLRMRGGIEPEVDPRAIGMTLDEMYGLWGVDFVAIYSSDPGLRVSDQPSEMTFDTITASVKLNLAEGDDAKLRQFANACQSE